MSILNFSEYKYVKSFDADEAIRLGGFSTASSGQMENVRVFIYIQDFTALAGNEQLVMKLYSSTAYSNILMTSNTISLSDITFDTSDVAKENFIGYVRFDFDSQWINSANTYYPTVTISNYTPNAALFYIGLCYDFPDPVYSNGGTNFFDQSIAMQIFMKQARSV